MTVWSPVSWRSAMRQSIHARQSLMIGEPLSPTRQPTPLNLSAPLVAKTRERSSWSSLRMLTQKAPDGSIRGQLVDDFAGAKPTSGGSSDRLGNDSQGRA